MGAVTPEGFACHQDAGTEAGTECRRNTGASPQSHPLSPYQGLPLAEAPPQGRLGHEVHRAASQAQSDGGGHGFGRWWGLGREAGRQKKQNEERKSLDVTRLTCSISWNPPMMP